MTLLTVLLLTLVSTCLAQPEDNNNSKERTSRAPQGQIQYNDPAGSKINWKLYAPHNQWRSHLASTQRLQRAETGTSQMNFSPKQQASVIQAPAQLQPQYQPYSAVPNHIKKLINEAYTYEGPYVDPGAFFYQAFAPIAVSPLATHTTNDQFAHPQTHQLERGYINAAVNNRVSGYQANAGLSNSANIGRATPKAGIKYKDEERLTERSASLPYGSVIGAQSREKAQYQPYKQISQSQQPQSSELQKQYRKENSDSRASFSQYNGQNSPINSQNPQNTKQSTQLSQYNKQSAQPRQYQQLESTKYVAQTNHANDMPTAIQRLLSYQAQLPYNVIANQIVFRPKQLFIPKPLPESAKLSRQYPSKVYFLKTDGQIYESSEVTKDENKNDKRY